MKLKPLGNRIVVKRVEEQTKTAGGIIIPDSAVEKPSEGIVQAIGLGKSIAVGDGIEIDVLEVKVGDRVLFGKYTGMEVAIDGEAFIIMTEDDVLGILQEETVNG